jgi:hypothetical protein
MGFLPKEFVDSMNMTGDIFTTRSPDDVTEAMQEQDLSASSGRIHHQMEGRCVDLGARLLVWVAAED